MLKILILDDEKIFTSELSEFLQKNGIQTAEANTVSEGRRLLEEDTPDLLILDVRLPGADGLDVLQEVKSKYPDIEVIIVSGHGDMDTVIRALRLGAIDYLKKPFRHLDIQIAVERTQKFLLLQKRLKEVEEKNSLISKKLEERIERHFIGVSKKIKEVMDLVMTAAQFSDTSVMITGESGTGKENIARIIHFASNRKDNLFCAVNSSAITETLLESEFFGHKKGSFTGAITDKKGFFEISDKGTLFLDEIADMPLSLQAKVLRALEEKKITRVGDTLQISTDFRMISATNAEVDKMIEEKKFRLDLIHRLRTLHIHIPPLRERPEDIEPLLDFFVSDFSTKFNKPMPGIGPGVIESLQEYSFPGNVRELRNMVERALILSRKNVLEPKDFPVAAITSEPKTQLKSIMDLNGNEADLVRKALIQSNFNQKKAAESLGITRDALIRKMKKYKIVVKKSGE
ncbi:MAG: sigma-54 dependent transcriptional regulator [Bacteroidota bacterium]